VLGGLAPDRGRGGIRRAARPPCRRDPAGPSRPSARARHRGGTADRRKRLPAGRAYARGAGVLCRRNDVPSGGWYVGPAIVAVNDPHAPIAGEELFGPLLAVLRAADFAHALALAADTAYALTGGVFSRRPGTSGRPPKRFAPGTCTSTAALPARGSAASRSAATACRASARKQAAPSISCSSSSRAC
jgi:aldehyde dehydrogenase family protein